MVFIVFISNSMKKIICLLCVSLWLASGFAKDRSLKEMQQIAASVLQSNYSGAKVRRPSLRQSFGKIMANGELTVIGADEAGFVVISNDDHTDAVLGYSAQAFRASGNPEFQWWLNSITKVLAAERASGYPSARRIVKPDNQQTVDSLIVSRWGQDAPYFNLCPNHNGNHYPTGCQATAMAQIMYYWKSPARGTGSGQYSFDGKLYKADFGSTVYEWSKMLDDYSKAYSEEQGNAVATLMWQCGVAVHMQYTPSGSGAYSVEACKALNNYFGYKDARLYNRDFYSESSWMKMVYEEISARRPILYTGVDASQGGHAFVLDGYNADGLVHINWGWNGKENGYFDISKLNPSPYSFSLQQTMITGITTKDLGHEYISQIGSPNLQMSSTSTRITLSGTFLNEGTQTFEGIIGMAVVNLSTGDSTVVKAQRYKLIPYLDGKTYSEKGSFQSPWLRTPGVTYRVFLASKADNETTWQLLRNNNVENGGVCASYLLTVDQDNKITVKVEESDMWTTGVRVIPDKETRRVTAFDLQGREIYSASSRDFKIENVHGHGVVIIKDNDGVRKVLKK